MYLAVAYHGTYIISLNPHNPLDSNISPFYRWGNCITECFNKVVWPPHSLSGLKGCTPTMILHSRENTVKEERRGEKKGSSVRDISRKVAGTKIQSLEPKYESITFSFLSQEKEGWICGAVGGPRRNSGSAA